MTFGALLLCYPLIVFAQTPVIKLDDAIARARQYGGQVQSAEFAVLQAQQDTVQARAARLPRSARSISSSIRRATGRRPAFSSPTTACTSITSRRWCMRKC